MNIGIIGTGNIGTVVGRLLREAGHEVVCGTRSPKDDADIRSNEEATRFGGVVIVAVPYGARPDLVREIGPLLGDKVVVDAGNPDRDRDGSFGEEGLDDPKGPGAPVARLVPTARFMRTFTVIEAGMLGREAHRDGERLGLPVAGDDPEAVALVAALVADTGFTPVLSGDLASAKRFDRGTPIFGGGLTGPEIDAAFGKETALCSESDPYPLPSRQSRRSRIRGASALGAVT